MGDARLACALSIYLVKLGDQRLFVRARMGRYHSHAADPSAHSKHSCATAVLDRRGSRLRYNGNFFIDSVDPACCAGRRIRILLAGVAGLFQEKRDRYARCQRSCTRCVVETASVRSWTNCQSASLRLSNRCTRPDRLSATVEERCEAEEHAPGAFWG